MLTRFFRRHWRAYLLLLCFDLLISRSFLGNRTLYWGDLVLYFQPMYHLMQRSLQHGLVPLWNPYILCGQPLLGNPQMGIFYPATIMLGVCSTWNMIRIACIVHLWLCGAWTYHFLTRWTANGQAPLAGGLVFMGSACVLGRLQFPPMLFAAAYLPLLLLTIDATLDRRSPRAPIGLTVATALILLAAHPHMAYLALLCCAAYALARIGLLSSGQPVAFVGRRTFRRLCGNVFAPMALGTACAAVQLLPALQVMLESPRERMTPGQANRFVVDPAHLLTLIWPHFLGHPATRDYWGPGNVWEPALFIGWAPLVLAAYGAIRGNGSALTRFWLVLTGFCLWLAMGVDAGLYAVAFYVLPGLGKFHDPARFALPATFGAAVLVAIGLDAARRNCIWCTNRVGMGILASIALPLIWFAPEWLPAARIADLASSRPLAGWGSHSGRIYLPAHELISRNYISAGYTDYGDNGAVPIAAMLDTRMPNLNIDVERESASGYEPVPLRGPAAVDGLARIAYRRGEPNLGAFMRIMDVGELVLPGSVHLHLPSAAKILPSNLHYRTVQAFKLQNYRFCWTTRVVRHVQGEMRTGAFLAAPSFDPMKVAMISDEIRSDEFDLDGPDQVRPAMPANPEGNTIAGDTIRELVRTKIGTEVSLIADAGAEPAYLVISMAAFPGWQATVDGKPCLLHRTDDAILGLYLPAGAHRVRLSYAPACYRVGLYASLLSLLAAVSIATWIFRRPARTLSE